MPQKPTMPSPYMETVDASEPITFSCEIDSRDTITDYKLNFTELGTLSSSESADEPTLPPIFVDGMICKDKYKHQILFYKQTEDSDMCTIVVTPTTTEDDDEDENKSGEINEGKDFETSSITVERGQVAEIIYRTNSFNYTLNTGDIGNFPNVTKIQIVSRTAGRMAGQPFLGCKSLKEVVLWGNWAIKSIRKTVFESCDKLEKIVLPHVYAMCRDSGGEDIYFVPDVKELVFKNIYPENAKFAEHNGSRFKNIKEVDKSTGHKGYICVFSADVGTEAVTAISACNSDGTELRGLKNLEKVTFLCDVESIGVQTFSECTKLREVCFPSPSTLKTIEKRAFYKCSSLENFFTILSRTEEIGEEAFSNSGIKTLIINESLKKIKAKAFEVCSGLNSIIISGLNPEVSIAKDFFPTEVDPLDIYGLQDLLSNENLLSGILDKNPNAIFHSIYEMGGYTQLPFFGGNTEGKALSYELSENTLKNDKEYIWNIELTDSYGKKIISPNYYFRTKSAPIVQIQEFLTEVTERITVNGDSENYLELGHEPVEGQPCFIVGEPLTNASLLAEEDEEVFVPTVSAYTEGKLVKREVNDMATYTYDGETGFFTINYVPTKNDVGSYCIDVLLPYVLESDKELISDKWVAVTLEAENGTQDVNEQNPIQYKIASEFEDDIELENGVSYPAIYDTPFEGESEYKITYFCEPDGAIINSNRKTFSAVASMKDDLAGSVPVKCFRWILYEYDAKSDTKHMVDDSGKIYGSNLTYTFTRFLPNTSYCLEIEIENDEGVTATDEYHFSTGNEYSVTLKEEPKIALNKKENSVLIKLYDASVFYSIIRTDVERGTYKLIAEEVHGEQTVYDYTAASNTKYVYTIYGHDTNGNVSVFTSKEIRPEWCAVSIIGFVGSYADESPIIIDMDDAWFFWLNVEKIDYTQNMAKQMSQAFSSRYPHISTGKTNYGTFNISALIGDVSGCDYIGDSTIRVEKFQDFIASNKAKLVVDTKGRVSVCDALNSSNGYETGYLEQQTTINVSLTEIAPSDKVSLIAIKAGV